MSEKSISESGYSASSANLRFLAGVSLHSANVLRTSLLITVSLLRVARGFLEGDAVLAGPLWSDGESAARCHFSL